MVKANPDTPREVGNAHQNTIPENLEPLRRKPLKLFCIFYKKELYKPPSPVRVSPRRQKTPTSHTMKTEPLQTICRARRGLAPLNRRRAFWPAALACLVIWITLAIIAAALLS